MKSYVLAMKDGSFVHLPTDIQINQDALRFVAKRIGVKFKKNRAFDKAAFNDAFKESDCMYVLCDGSSFFPHGKTVTMKVPKAQVADERKERLSSREKPDLQTDRSKGRWRKEHGISLGSMVMA